QWSRRAVAQFLGNHLQTPANQFVTLDRRSKRMSTRTRVAVHTALCLQPIEQLLDRGVMRVAAARVKDFCKLANCRRPAIPEQAKHRELGIRNVLGSHIHSQLHWCRYQTDCLTRK